MAYFGDIFFANMGVGVVRIIFRAHRNSGGSAKSHALGQRTLWGGGKKRGVENLTNDTPPKKGFWTPPLVTFSTPLRCQCSFFFPVQKSTTERTRSSFGGVQKFPGERVLWYVFLPPYFLHPPISRPNWEPLTWQKLGFCAFSPEIGKKLAPEIGPRIGPAWKTAQWAKRDTLMSRGQNCRETVFVSQLSRSYPHRGVILKKKNARSWDSGESVLPRDIKVSRRALWEGDREKK